ncbi:MAG: FAD-binding oxidoreductase [Alphaproteobacteria bacterium]|nr:FAD-binding oxidoreductase [Alphaproteobacteria bacterium]
MSTPSSETVVIIGGAIVGSSVAFFLRELGFGGRVVVVERDPTYRTSSTALSAASIRTQFGCAVNIRMSLFGADFFRRIKERFGPEADIGFIERGYLILGGPEDAASRRAGVALQREEGADIADLAPAEAKARFPWLNVDGLGIATNGRRNEGWFDAWSLLSVVRRAARERGVTYVEGNAEAIVVRNGRVAGIRIAGGETIAADWCVDAAGPASAAIVRDLGIQLPVVPRKRTVFSIKAPLDGKDFPMLFDTTGAWMRPEGEGFICGIAPEAARDPDAFGDFEPDFYLLEEAVWPALAHRVPALEQLRLERAWAGHYEVNTLDHNGIIGPHDEIANLLFATGFSGHGVMHSPATGRGIAELILYGHYVSLDLSPLGFGRIKAGTPLPETVIY